MHSLSAVHIDRDESKINGKQLCTILDEILSPSRIFEFKTGRKTKSSIHPKMYSKVWLAVQKIKEVKNEEFITGHDSFIKFRLFY